MPPVTTSYPSPSFPLRPASPDFQTLLDDRAPTKNDRRVMAEQLAMLTHQPVISVVMPVFNPPEAYLREAIDSVLAQVYPHWELCIADDASTEPYVKALLHHYQQADRRIKVVFREENGHVSKASNSALDLATGEFIALLDHDDLLTADALYEVVHLINCHPEADMVYSDEDQLSEKERKWVPFLKFDWCPDTFLSWMYTCHLGVYRRSLVNDLGGFRLGYEGSQDYDLVLRLSEQTSNIFHIPKVLYRWRVHSESVISGANVKPYAYEAGARAIADALVRRQEPGRVVPHPERLGSYTVRYTIRHHDRVSIIIPTRDHGNLLAACLESIFTQTTYPNYEVVVIDNGSLEPTTAQVLAFWKTQEPERFRYFALDIPFNFSAINNYAVQQVTGTYLVFLNNDTEVITPDWLEGMVEQAQRPTIGAVGATLYYPDNTIQHSGVVLGMGIVAANDHGDYQRVRNVSAVTAACLMCRRETFTEVNGFDEALGVAFNDVDFCLKLLQRGYRNICLDHVQIYHYESKSRGLENDVSKILRYSQEIERVSTRWQAWLAHDPCNSPYYIWRHGISVPYEFSLSVVVPWWDHSELLELWERNLSHLQGVQVIFVDNGSKPEGAAALRDFCHTHGVTLIRNQENRGFSAANNQGVAIATGAYILHLNNDLDIQHLPIPYLCAAARDGIAGPGPASNELGIRYAEGWCLCIRRSTLEALGGWNEAYGPGYWDDVDLCHRVAEAGYPVMMLPELRQLIRHITNATGRDGRINQLALHNRNRGIFIRTYYTKRPTIVIDGVFFQRYKTGIARVWRTLLSEWAGTTFANHLVVLDRAKTAPQIPGIRYHLIPTHDYNRLEDDRELLQELCDEEGADLFISTYYSTPLSTPSVLMVHDMIPEVAATKDSDVNLDDFMWREKRQAIQQAAAYITVSENTARDLVRFFPEIDPTRVTIAKEGVASLFKPASAQAITDLKRKYGIHKPYFLLVGSSIGYKNTILFYRSLAYLDSRYGFDIISVGSGGILEDEFRACTEGMTVHLLRLTDQELATAYSGAIALVYPSQYEGFGLPIVEAMACGCPVITCANGSIPEVAGDAVIYVDDADVLAMAEALCEVQKPSVRQRLSAAGQAQAAQFSWTKMAEIVAYALIDATLLPLNLSQQNLILFPDWRQPEDAIAASLAEVLHQVAIQLNNSPTLLIDTTNSEPEAVDELLSSIIMALALEEGLDVTESIQISLLPKLGELQWQVLAPKLTARVPIALEHRDAIKTAGLEQLSVWKLELV